MHQLIALIVFSLLHFFTFFFLQNLNLVHWILPQLQDPDLQKHSGESMTHFSQMLRCPSFSLIHLTVLLLLDMSLSKKVVNNAVDHLVCVCVKMFPLSLFGSTYPSSVWKLEEHPWLNYILPQVT